MSGTLRKALFWTAGLIGAYIVVVHYTGARADITAGGKAGSNVVRTLQGR